jgi:hypothetical protein
MPLLSRIVVIVVALIVASALAGLVLVVAIIAADMDSDRIERVSFFVNSFFTTGFYGAVAIVPVLVLIGLGEALRMRSFIYYGAAGLLVGLASYFGCDISGALENTTDIPPVGYALPLAAAAGIIGGVVYWLVAGRKAGGWRAG